MVVNDEWDLDDTFFDSWCDGMDCEQKEAEITITNEEFLIHHTNDIEFRTYIIKELNRLNSLISNNYDVAE